jgi:hypothetical protein
MHNEELHNLNSVPNIVKVIKSKRMRWVGYVAHTEEVIKIYKILFRRPEGKRPLGRHRHRWEDNINMDFKEIECESVDWIHLAQDRDR